MILSLLLCGHTAYAAEAKLKRFEGEYKRPGIAQSVPFYSREFEDKYWDKVSVTVKPMEYDAYASNVSVKCSSGDFDEYEEKYEKQRSLDFVWCRGEEHYVYDRLRRVYGASVKDCIIAPDAQSVVLWGETTQRNFVLKDVITLFSLCGSDDEKFPGDVLYHHHKGTRPFFVDEATGNRPILGLYRPDNYPPARIVRCFYVKTGEEGGGYAYLGLPGRPCEKPELNKDLLDARMTDAFDERSHSQWWWFQCKDQDFACDICSRLAAQAHEQCTGEGAPSLHRLLRGFIERHDIWSKLPEKPQKKRKWRQGWARDYIEAVNRLVAKRKNGEMSDESSGNEEERDRKRRKLDGEG